MTTIAYHHESKTIAVDGLILRGGMVMSDSYQKWRTRASSTFFFSGTVADIEPFINAATNNAKYEWDLDLSCLRVKDGKIYECGIDENGYWEIEAMYSVAIGSGCDLALAGFDMGLNATQAVELAAKRNAGTGGKIFSFTLDEISKFKE